jgi:hypothetical protein
MADTQPTDSKPKKDRSPSFPFIALPDAIKRLQAFEQTFGRHPAPGVKVGLAWGMKDKSSQAYQILAALKAFGMVKYEGSGPNLKATLTEDSRTYLRAQQASIRDEVVKHLALKPAQFQKFWGIWGADRPPDPVCLDQLILQHAFTDSAANNFLRVYDNTIAFAGLSNANTTVDEEAGDDPPLEFKIGDLVNWESGGQVQWRAPRKIVSIDEKDGQFFYQVEGLGELAGQTGWIPAEQAVEGKAPVAEGFAMFAPPPSDRVSENRDGKANDPVPEGVREDKASLDEGEVILRWPESLSADSVADFEYWVNGIIKRAKRRAGLDEKGDD